MAELTLYIECQRHQAEVISADGAPGDKGMSFHFMRNEQDGGWELDGANLYCTADEMELTSNPHEEGDFLASVMVTKVTGEVVGTEMHTLTTRL